jgi:DNA modification methylase
MLELRPLVLDENNIVLWWNMRLRWIKELWYEKAPVLFAKDLTEEQKKEFIIKDNVWFWEWDFDLLANEWEPLQLEEWGLDLPWITDLINIEEAEEDNFEIKEDIKTDIVKGDLFWFYKDWKELHRLLCWDSTNIDEVEKLMNGEKADMVFTDPPYWISLVKNNMVGADFGVAKKWKYENIIADDTTNTAKDFFKSCLALWMNNYIIWWWNYFVDFLPFSDGWLIWNKRAWTEIKNTFADWEMAWCSFHTPIRIYNQLWNWMIREWEKDKRVHPTQKPIKILSEIIQDHIKWNIIYDWFLWSGSTMVASHQLKRKCYWIELSEKYCQVIIDRMKKLDPTLEIKKI